jgi:hypothetical protein
VYDKKNHPKYLICKSTFYFDTIFAMLRSGDAVILEPVWDLIQKIPVNVKLLMSLRDLTEIKAAFGVGDKE